MNKYVLPSVAAFLILVIAFSSYTPAMAATRITLTPFLQVVTIPQDDQIRNTGVMILGKGLTDTPANQLYPDLMAQFKIIVTLNGVIVPKSGVTIWCNVVEKDKVLNPPDVTTGKTPSTKRQFPREFASTKLVDVADMFVCKPHWKNNLEAVGVLDVYFVGTPGDAAFIADHILVVGATYTTGRQTFVGAEIQDICILGWSMEAAVYNTHPRDLDYFAIYPDALGDYASCEALALYQLNQLTLWP
jgi:hypothetical protein